MKRGLLFLLRNWPLKLAAVLLATMLYSGLVLSQNVRSWTGTLPVDPIQPPPGATLVADIEPVTLIRYRAPLDVGILTPDSFRASVNLARVEPRPGGEAQEVPVTVLARDRGVQIIDYQPQTVQVRLDSIESEEFDVSVEHGPVPEGLNVSQPQTEPSSVRVRGAASRVAAIQSVVARVTLDGSALNVDREVEVVALDGQGNQVSSVEIEPERVRVRMAVAVELATRTVPVVPQLVGQLPDGHVATSIAVSPLSVTVTGAEPVVSRLETALTEPIDVSQRTQDFETTVGFTLPEEASVVGTARATVSVSISEERGSRLFPVGISLVGPRPDLVYQLSTPQVAVTLGGPLTELNRLDPAQLSAEVDVSGLPPGSHSLALTFVPPAGLELVSLAPGQLLVTVEQAPQPSVTPGTSVFALPAL